MKKLNPHSVAELHDHFDQGKVDDIASSLRKKGWIGRPILVMENGNEWHALTGTHRLRAASSIQDFEVPVSVVSYNADILDARDDYDRLELIAEIWPNSEAHHLMREEVDQNE